MKRETAITAIKSLPEEFDLDVAIETLMFVANVEEGIAQADAGQTIPHSEIVAMVKQWKKSGGPKKQRSI